MERVVFPTNFKNEVDIYGFHVDLMLILKARLFELRKNVDSKVFFVAKN